MAVERGAAASAMCLTISGEQRFTGSLNARRFGLQPSIVDTGVCDLDPAHLLAHHGL